jgi:molybdenum cofactor guanylyltransferase
VEQGQLSNPGGIILAGGQSRRMGTDKGLLRLQPDGPRMVEIILAAVRPLVGSVVISRNKPADYAFTGLPLVGDNFKDKGPLAGLEAGLAASSAEYNLVVACDMPWLEPKLLEYLLSQVEGYLAVVPLNEEGREEPLCAVYSKECLPAIRQRLVQDSLKMSAWLADVKTRFIPAQKLREFDPGLRTFKNLNRPEDLPLLYNNEKGT